MAKVIVTSLLSDYFYDAGTIKKYEIRLKNKKFGNLKRGDFLLCFLKDGKGLFKLLEIKEVYEFDSVEELLDMLDFKEIAPKARSKEEVAEILGSIYGKQLKDHKIIAFRVKSRATGKITKEHIKKYTKLF